MPDGSEASMSCIESSCDGYIPPKNSIRGSSSEGSQDLTNKVPLVKQKKPKKTYKRKTFASTKRSESEHSDTSLENVSVLKQRKRKIGGRVHSKRHHCLYCPMQCHRMARHLVRKHSNQSAVAKAISFPLNSKERKLHFRLIQNKGNHAHNNEVLKNGRGTLIPSYQTKEPVNASDYMHCIYCEALLKRKSLWRHVSRCKLSRNCSTTKPGQSRVQSLCAFAQPVPDGVSKKVWQLTNAMQQDEVTNIIKEEKSILRFGEHLYVKLGHDNTKHVYIRQKMREIGRLVRQAQNAGRLKHMEDFYVPSNFNSVVEAVRELAGFHEHSNSYKTPSLALKLGHSLKKIADILQCEAQMAESDNEEFLKNLERSRSIYEKKWDVCVSPCALQTLKEGRQTTSLDQNQINPEEEVPEAVESDLSETEAQESSFNSRSSGSLRSKKRQPMTDESDDDIAPTGSSTPKRKMLAVDSDDDPKTGPVPSTSKKMEAESERSDPKTETSKKRGWSPAEVQAVEKR
ncbi:uncharacterized protein LOC116675982 [Etheostoma spectabile]|uniref:uncharacterized protein LOC116675982 n=1 Tax=Etheostoma spectabile TaxID=54343 RepID=UPI0013AF4ECB|nr:uncharacterized protein LOC116675982 [Etheostoma spectabile]